MVKCKGWAILSWWEDLVPSMVRCKGWAILSWWEDLVPSMLDVSAEPFWCVCRIGSYMIRSKCWMPFLEWRHLVSYHVAQSGTGGHSNMTIGLVPTLSDVSASPFEHACWIGSSHVSDVSADPFWTCMLDWFLACVRCKCRSLSNMHVGLVPHMCWM